MNIAKTGDYAALAALITQAREKRAEAQRKARANAEHNAHALTAIATDLQRLITRAQAIPGSYLVWARLTDAQSDALALAKEWEERAR